VAINGTECRQDQNFLAGKHLTTVVREGGAFNHLCKMYVVNDWNHDDARRVSLLPETEFSSGVAGQIDRYSLKVDQLFTDWNHDVIITVFGRAGSTVVECL
jgi:hypothetical protein